MAYQGISTGTSANDGTGDSLATGAVKINSNFQELYNAFGDGSSINFNKSRNIIAGAGLTGGGDLTADRTFNVGQGDGITVSADSIAVNSSVVRTTGNQSVSGYLKIEKIRDVNNSDGSSNEVLTSSNVGNSLDWANVNDLVSGRVVQIVRATYSTQTSHLISWGDTGLTASITPSSINSKIIILVNQPYTVVGGGNAESGSLRIVKSSSTVLYSPGDSCFSTRVSGGNDEWCSAIASLQYVDTPGTTSTVTYKTQGRSYNTDNRFRTQIGSNQNNIIPATSQIYLIELS